MSIIIACLSQKGGVGKSTISRLLARTYASHDWAVKICDFNVKQLTSVDWVAFRMQTGVEPVIDAQPMSKPKALKSERHDLLVIDGAPDADAVSLELAKMADLVVIPTGIANDDLKPQIAFAKELVAKGVPNEKILWVMNKTLESEVMLRDAIELIRREGFDVAPTDLALKTGYAMAQNKGLAISETTFSTLNDRADQLAADIVNKLNAIKEKNAA